MKRIQNKERRDFLKVSAAAGGGMMIGFTWLASCAPDKATIVEALAQPNEWFEMNGFIKIGDTGLVTIISPNPEIGQNIKTSMPMIVAEELEVDWKDVVVEQGPLNTETFERQVAGGSQSIRHGWKPLRTVGATAKRLLMEAAAKRWETSIDQLTVNNGVITNADGQSFGYGELASEAATMEVPEDITLKDPKDFKIIGQGKSNVDLDDIVTGKPLFGIDFKKEGMVHAVVKRPDAFGMKVKSFNDEATRAVNGVLDVVQFDEFIAVVAKNTWAAIKGKRVLEVEYEAFEPLESSTDHTAKMLAKLKELSDEPKRNDGDIQKAFEDVDFVLERVFESPFLPHNPLEPMNFFAHVTDEKVELIGPTQTPQWQQGRIADQLERDASEIRVDMTRMGGGFGRRLYGNFVTEAAAISDKIRKPVHLLYTREDDFNSGPYRPAIAYQFKAGVKDGKVTAYHLTGVGTNAGNTVRDQWFPAGSIPNLRIDAHNVETNIPTGAWRAPVTNFLASCEQSFFDELAGEMKMDPIDLRLRLLNDAKENLVGEIDYDIDKMIGVIKKAREMSDWDSSTKNLGFSAYYCHNTYVAEVADVDVAGDEIKVNHIDCVVDCGIVINPLGAVNQIEGGIIDGIGHAMFGEFSFKEGRAEQNNFHNYRMIRMKDVPTIDIEFIKSNNDPTGLGEPTLPPAGAAVANGYFKASGKRLYKQPFFNEINNLG